MVMNQQDLTDKVLFDYYMVSSTRQNEVYTPFPFFLDREVFNDIVSATVILDKLVNRFIRKLISEKDTSFIHIDEFPLKEEILNLQCTLPQFFWARYDAFERADGGIFFSEFNYDKPCAQREIAFSDMLKPHNNPNESFILRFREGFKHLWEQYNKTGKVPKVAILVDPGHYEELHLAQFYIELLRPLNYEITIIGGKNIYLENERVMAFGEEIDILLRQFPTEYLNEIKDFDNILKLYSEGKVLILNDPRAIVGQAKSIFATFWEMVERDDPFLTLEEKEVICSKLPFTKIFRQEMVDELITNKDKYVVKAVLGRFSEEVYIGQMHTAQEWEETIEYVVNSEKLHIVQQFCPIKKARVLRFNGFSYEEAIAFGNFGIYLVNGDYAGTSLRFSGDYLSSEDAVWISAVGLRNKSYKLRNFTGEDRLRTWNEINDEAAFQHDYTGGYQGAQEAFSLQVLTLDKATYQELKSASLGVAAIFKKVTDFVCENNKILCPVLGISESVIELVKQKPTGALTFIGRFDWVIDTKGSLKLLEFNSETPAGLLESMVLNDIIKRKLNIEEENPNVAMKGMIRDSFNRILNDFKIQRDIRNIGVVSGSYGEDWYNTTIVFDLIKGLPYKILMGEVSGLVAEKDKLSLYGTELDAIYRYYPLDWFDEDEYYNGVIGALGQNTLSINPTSTFINQSKAFLALVYELKDKGFFANDEKELIEKYIPITALAPSKSFGGIFCAKPCFGREGEGIAFSFKEPFPIPGREDYIFQEWIDIQNVSLDIHSYNSVSQEIAYPVIGTYLIGDDFGGIYTRAGSNVTDKWALFIPTYIENEK